MGVAADCQLQYRQVRRSRFLALYERRDRIAMMRGFKTELQVNDMEQGFKRDGASFPTTSPPARHASVLVFASSMCDERRKFVLPVRRTGIVVYDNTQNSSTGKIREASLLQYG